MNCNVIINIFAIKKKNTHVDDLNIYYSFTIVLLARLEGTIE